MRSLKLAAVVLCSVVTIISGVSRRAISASESHPQQAAGILTTGTLTPTGLSVLHGIADAARNDDLRWPDFAPYKTEFSKFYETNGPFRGCKRSGCDRRLAVIEVLKHTANWERA